MVWYAARWVQVIVYDTDGKPDVLDELKALIESGELVGAHMEIVERAIQEIEELRAEH